MTVLLTELSNAIPAFAEEIAKQLSFNHTLTVKELYPTAKERAETIIKDLIANGFPTGKGFIVKNTGIKPIMMSYTEACKIHSTITLMYAGGGLKWIFN